MDIISEVIAMAMQAPSSLNTQPWNVTVKCGAALDAIRQGNTERNLAGVPTSRAFTASEGYEGARRERKIGIAKQLFSAMDIARDDKVKRRDRVLRGFRQFDAPISIIMLPVSRANCSQQLQGYRAFTLHIMRPCIPRAYWA